MTTGPRAPGRPPSPTAPPDAPRIAVRGEARIEVDPEIARINVTFTAHAPTGAPPPTTSPAAPPPHSTSSTATEQPSNDSGQAPSPAPPNSPRTATPQRPPRAHPRLPRPRPPQRRTQRLHRTRRTHHPTGRPRTHQGRRPLAGPAPRLTHPPRSPATGRTRSRAASPRIRRNTRHTLTALVELDDTGADDTDRRSRAARSVSRAAPDGTEAAGGPDPLAPEPRRRHIHARIDARFTMAPPRLQTIPVTRSDENSRPARNRPLHFSPGCSSERSTAQFNTCQYRFT